MKYVKFGYGRATDHTSKDIRAGLMKREKAVKLVKKHDSIKSRDLKRVASIPTLALSVWAKEYNGDGNWFALPKEVQSKILKTKLNSNEFKYFRTAEGKI